MKRNEWVFVVTSDKLRDAVQERCNYHLTRMSFWEAEREITNDAIAAAGVNVRIHPISGGERHELVIDATLSARLAECNQKIEQHNRSSDEYAQWAKALKEGRATEYELDFSDWQFFFGLYGDDDE